MERDEAYSAFAAARVPALYRSAWLLCGDRHLAEDLVQETLAKVYLVWGRRGIDNPAAYAHTTLVRTFISSRRRRSAHERPSEVHHDAPSATDPDVALRVDLAAALAQLGRIDRAVLVLRFFEDRSVVETAALLSLTPGAVRNRSSRALVRIRGLLGSESECLGGLT